MREPRRSFSQGKLIISTSFQREVIISVLDLLFLDEGESLSSSQKITNKFYVYVFRGNLPKERKSERGLSLMRASIGMSGKVGIQECASVCTSVQKLLPSSW